jgi:hypothetical protein
MAKLKDLLQQRFLKKEPKKMTQLAERSSEGTLSAFSGLFQMSELGEKERQELSLILEKYRDENQDIATDLRQLISLTGEVKAIQAQAALLHGERIKKAQLILKSYKEGAFTAWLLATYGNRQTPYNFLQYYEFHKEIPQTLHPMMETMPRQAIYTLASRDGDFGKKQEIVKNYKGETKEQLLTLIRTAFPLPEKDQRAENVGYTTIKELKKLLSQYERPYRPLSERQKKEIVSLLRVLEKKVS